MLKHIVLWRLHEQAEGNDKATNLRLVKEKLEGLNGVIPGLIKLEIGEDISRGAASFDFVLYSELESAEALEVYRTHPAHVAAADFVLAVTSDRYVVDYWAD